MKRFVAVLMIDCWVIFFESSSSGQQKRLITQKDLFSFQWIGDPQISADGSQVAFVRVVVGEKQEYEASIWVVSTSGGDPRKLTSGKRFPPPTSDRGQAYRTKESKLFNRTIIRL